MAIIDRATLGKHDRHTPGWYQGVYFELSEEEFILLHQTLVTFQQEVTSVLPLEVVNIIELSDKWYRQIQDERGMEL